MISFFLTGTQESMLIFGIMQQALHRHPVHYEAQKYRSEIIYRGALQQKADAWMLS